MSKMSKGMDGGLGVGGGHGRGGLSGHGLEGLGDVFSFTTDGTTVSAASVALPSGTTVALPLNTGVTYSVSGTDVVSTRTLTNASEVIRFSDTDADGLYQVVATSKVATAASNTVNALGFSMAKTVSATVSNGVVTDVSHTHWDGTTNVLLSSTVVPSNTTWTVSNGLLIETHTASTTGLSHYEIFRDGNADGVYTAVASGSGTVVDLVGVLAQTDSFASTL